jgi:hypothetical protein
MPGLMSLTTVIGVLHHRMLPSRDEFLRISIFRVVRNILPVRINHVIPWERIKMWGGNVIL